MSQCAAPLPLGDLLDWWLGDLDEERSEAVEDHFFACARCTARLDQVRTLGAGVVTLTREGALPLTGTSALLNRMSRDRRVLRQYSARPGQVISCTVSMEDEWLVSRLRAAEGTGEWRTVGWRREPAEGNDETADVDRHDG